MDVIQSQVQPSSAEFKENHARMKALVEELKERLSLISKGGSKRAVELHRSRGKLLARERIGCLASGAAASAPALAPAAGALLAIFLATVGRTGYR